MIETNHSPKLQASSKLTIKNISSEMNLHHKSLGSDPFNYSYSLPAPSLLARYMI